MNLISEVGHAIFVLLIFYFVGWAFFGVPLYLVLRVAKHFNWGGKAFWKKEGGRIEKYYWVGMTFVAGIFLMWIVGQLEGMSWSII